MLALDRPLGVIADLALFGDHVDAKRVYYIPTRPQLARAGADAEISFVKFRGSDAIEDGGAGFLSFTTELSVTEEQLDEAKDHVLELGVSEPVFSQVHWLGGKAYFAAALEEGDGFVEKLYGEVTPDLAGTNRAMFSMMLEEEGARLIEGLLNLEGPNPLGVRYELEYAGLRPALEVHIRADYKRVYDELSWGFELGAAYQGVGVRAGVESATKKLVESGAIQIEVLHFTDDADLKKRVDEAIRWLQDKILEDFFKSSLHPPAQKTLQDRAIEAALALGAATLQDALADTSLAGLLAEQLGLSPDALQVLGQGGGGQAAGGASGGSGFALKLQFSFKDIKEEELKTITLDWSEARAEKRTAAPQGLLSQIGPPPKIVEADESGEFWDRLKVNVRPLGDFADLGVERLIVRLRYPDEEAPKEERDLTFEPGESEPEVFGAWTEGKPLDYRTQTEAHFSDDGPWPGPPIFTGAWQSRQSLELAVHPFSDLPRVELEMSPGTLNFAETPQVQLDVRIDGDQVETHKLTEAEPTATVRQRLAAASGDGPVVEVKPTWFLAGGGRVEGDWLPADGNALLVNAPWRGRRTVRLFPALPEDFIDALVTLTLIESNRSETVEMSIQPGERRTKPVVLRSLSETAPPVTVDVVVIRGDMSTFTDQFETEQPVVLIRDRAGEHRQVSVRLLAGAHLADHGLIAVEVRLLGEADETLDSVVFTESQRDPGLLLVPAPDDGARSTRFRVVRYALDGLATEGPVEESSAAELLIRALAPS